ncbi:MAG: peptidoglycan editing factor PgeF [Planctomycetota bacterium]
MKIYQFPRLAADPRLVHGISSREKNISYSVTDKYGEKYGDPTEARREFFDTLQIDPERAQFAGQVHGSRVAWVAENVSGGALVRKNVINETDALITKTPDVGLFITAADCPPILMWDRKAGFLAAVHSGWRGTAVEIAVHTLREFAAAGSRAQNIQIGIGPGIGPCCYEVGAEVVECVPSRWRGSVVQLSAAGRPMLHLRKWIMLQIEEAGVPPENIEFLDYCTSCRTDLFFSHRAERGECGRFGLLAAFRTQC